MLIFVRNCQTIFQSDYFLHSCRQCVVFLVKLSVVTSFEFPGICLTHCMSRTHGVAREVATLGECMSASSSRDPGLSRFLHRYCEVSMQRGSWHRHSGFNWRKCSEGNTYRGRCPVKVTNNGWIVEHPGVTTSRNPSPSATSPEEERRSNGGTRNQRAGIHGREAMQRKL